jgi:hypothetical protein
MEAKAGSVWAVLGVFLGAAIVAGSFFHAEAVIQRAIVPAGGPAVAPAEAAPRYRVGTIVAALVPSAGSNLPTWYAVETMPGGAAWALMVIVVADQDGSASTGETVFIEALPGGVDFRLIGVATQILAASVLDGRRLRAGAIESMPSPPAPEAVAPGPET